MVCRLSDIVPNTGVCALVNGRQVAVFRPATGEWFVRRADGSADVTRFGGPGDLPGPADYLGTGETQFAVFRPATREWFVRTDTGGTLTKVANEIKAKGALKVYACCVHGVLSGSALDLCEKSELEEMLLTDSIPVDASRPDKVKILSIAPLLGEAIRRNHEGESISELFV